MLFFIFCKAEELGRDPTLDEVFLKTHTKKKDNSWVDERAKKTYVRNIKSFISSFICISCKSNLTMLHDFLFE